MKLKFTLEEIQAIYKLSKMMAEADGVVLHKELSSIEEEIVKMGFQKNSYDELIATCESMPSIEALNRVYKFDSNKKKFVSAFLGYLITADDDINDAELALWKFVINVSDLPNMNIRQAIVFHNS